MYRISYLVAICNQLDVQVFFLVWKVILLSEWQRRVCGLGKCRKLECNRSAEGQNCCKSIQQAKGGCSSCLFSNPKLLGYCKFTSVKAQFT